MSNSVNGPSWLDRIRVVDGIFRHCLEQTDRLTIEPVENEDGSTAWEAYIGQQPDPEAFGVTPWAAVLKLAKLLEGRKR